MIHLILIGLAMGVFLHDAPPFDELALRLDEGWLALLVFGPKLLLAGLYGAVCQRAIRRLHTPGGVRATKRLNLFTSLLPVAALASYFLDLWAGALRIVRHAPPGGLTGPRDWVLVDEVVVMLPTLALIAWSWWAYYPIDRRMRDASILRRADEGLPIYPPWTRGQYVATQARNQFALILGPLFALMAWSECLVKLGAAGRITENQQLWLTPVGAGVVFLFAPFLIRRLWDTVPLPPGEVREKLLAMCARHRVKVRDLLLWRTYGGMINAAVMGLFGRFRFILLSDGLLDQLPEHEVEAVMAHELGHVRLKHLWWLLANAAAGIALLTLAAEGLAFAGIDWPIWIDLPLLAVAAAGWALMFGWVSRRVERQADTFAARHMAEVLEEIRQTHNLNEARESDPRGTDPVVFSPQAVYAMIGALQHVADLNHIPTARPSWRHGSIAWRQNYLRSLIDRPLDAPDVDRVVRHSNFASVTILLVTAALGLI